MECERFFPPHVTYLNNYPLIFFLKDYLFHSLLCHMANPASDIIAAKRAHEKYFPAQISAPFLCINRPRIYRYLDMDPTFQDTRECQLVAKLLQVR